MNSQRRGILILSIAMILCLSIVTQAYSRNLVVNPIPTGGTIVKEDVEVYWDPDGVQIVEAIDWGRPRPGDSVPIQVYIQNLGNEPSNLTLWISDWLPAEAQQFLLVSWDYTGQVLEVLEIIPVIITLDVDPGIHDIHDFSFDIGIGIASIHG